MDSVWEILKGLVLTLVTAALVHFGAMNRNETPSQPNNASTRTEVNRSTSEPAPSADIAQPVPPSEPAEIAKPQFHPQNHPQKSKLPHHLN